MPQTPEQEEVSRLVTAVFDAWQKAGISFLVLRNYESLPDSTSNDIDVLIEPARIRAAEECMIAAARSANFRLHNRAEFATLACYFSSKRSTAQAHFDLFSNLKWRSFDFLGSEQFLARKVSREPFYIPHPAHEAATNLLANLIYTGKVKEKYKHSIATGFRGEPAVATPLLAQTYGQRSAEMILSTGAREDWQRLEAAAPELRRALIARQLTRRPLATLASFIRDGTRLLKRIFRPPGLTVVLCGPDGSGKSTAGRAIVEGISTTFSPLKGRQFHWKPAIFTAGRMASRGPTQSPHGNPPRNICFSLAYFGFHLVEFILGSRLRILPVTFRGGLVLIDRYYYDFFVDQRRYRLKIPSFLVRFGYHMVKKPDLVLVLDAPAETLQARKQEVPLAESQRQRESFLSLIQGLHNGRVVNANQPTEKVAADCVRIILDFMAERNERRVASTMT